MKRAAAALLLLSSACTAELVSSPTPAPTPTATVDATFEDLAARLFDEPLAGFVAVPEETRGLTIEDVVSDSIDAGKDRARLSDHGFRRGFARTWSSDDDSEHVIYALVYEFETAEGAKADFDDAIAEAKADGAEFFDAAGIDGAVGLTRKPKPGAEAEESTFHAVAFVSGERYFLVTIGGPVEPSRDDVLELGRRMSAAAG